MTVGIVTVVIVTVVIVTVVIVSVIIVIVVKVTVVIATVVIVIIGLPDLTKYFLNFFCFSPEEGLQFCYFNLTLGHFSTFNT